MKLLMIKVFAMAMITSIGSSVFAAEKITSPQLSVQLWSVKDDVTADFEGTLKKLKAMGFQGVEFAGNFGLYANDAKGLKKFLDENGLKASGAHVHFDKLSRKKLMPPSLFIKRLIASI